MFAARAYIPQERFAPRCAPIHLGGQFQFNGSSLSLKIDFIDFQAQTAPVKLELASQVNSSGLVARDFGGMIE
jgi:hypothetical protein